MKDRKLHINHIVGSLIVKSVSDIIDGKQYDTEIKFGKQTLCWVSGSRVHEFVTKLRELVNEYKI